MLQLFPIPRAERVIPGQQPVLLRGRAAFVLLAEQVGRGDAEVLCEQLDTLNRWDCITIYKLPNEILSRSAFVAGTVGLTPFNSQYFFTFCTNTSLFIGNLPNQKLVNPPNYQKLGIFY